MITQCPLGNHRFWIITVLPVIVARSWIIVSVNDALACCYTHEAGSSTRVMKHFYTFNGAGNEMFLKTLLIIPRLTLPRDVQLPVNHNPPNIHLWYV